MTSRPSRDGPWHGRTQTHFVTRGAECVLAEGGWFAKAGKKVRGPLSSLPVALEAADSMLAELKRTVSGDGNGPEPSAG